MDETPRRLKAEAESYKAAGERWDSGVACALGPISVAQWCETRPAQIAASASASARCAASFSPIPRISRCCRWSISLPAASTGQGEIYRIPGGNDAAAAKGGRRTWRAAFSSRRWFVASPRQDSRRVTVSFEDAAGRTDLTADFAVVATPATTTRKIDFSAAAAQRTADRDCFASLW